MFLNEKQKLFYTLIFIDINRVIYEGFSLVYSAIY